MLVLSNKYALIKEHISRVRPDLMEHCITAKGAIFGKMLPKPR